MLNEHHRVENGESRSLSHTLTDYAFPLLRRVHQRWSYLEQRESVVWFDLRYSRHRGDRRRRQANDQSWPKERPAIRGNCEKGRSSHVLVERRFRYSSSDCFGRDKERDRERNWIDHKQWSTAVGRLISLLWENSSHAQHRSSSILGRYVPPLWFGPFYKQLECTWNEHQVLDWNWRSIQENRRDLEGHQQ